MKQLKCSDAGFDCDAVIQAEDEDEVMVQAGEHAREVHGLDAIDDATASRIRAQIQDAPA
jgi:predicted small metal-binding protein